MESKYKFEDLEEIVRKLRSEDGCPWDREQTHSSLKKCMIEEAYEVVEGINRYEKEGDYFNLREELGDVLLQVVMHSQIAKEEGIFTMEDVIHEISEKMVRRHPHVFGSKAVKNAKDVIKSWEAIKKSEKREKNELDTLRYIPRSFPPLIRASKVLKKAEELYHVKEKEAEIISSMSTAIEELRCESNEKSNLRNKELIGKLMLDITKLAKRHKIDTEDALSDAIEEFIETYEANIN
ncbi:nucleoside triphosphate pyrophosphohydrolase [Clostridium sp. Marseille-P299]|uniref:nucleoside triphosphate pyrophosphohydrolase n=1 Tax=Clostridium sp. Marseille-P299 TaxID=1805477 RepID=UPI00082FAC12|nr:nucleoside triphosphate pyrophosphohydrolase [Clostridium sp. Marseille-P299]